MAGNRKLDIRPRVFLRSLEEIADGGAIFGDDGNSGKENSGMRLLPVAVSS